MVCNSISGIQYIKDGVLPGLYPKIVKAHGYKIWSPF